MKIVIDRKIEQCVIDFYNHNCNKKTEIDNNYSKLYYKNDILIVEFPRLNSIKNDKIHGYIDHIEEEYYKLIKGTSEFKGSEYIANKIYNKYRKLKINKLLNK